MLASVWMVISWIVAIGFHAPVEASAASYTPGVRLMLMCSAIGLIIGWPLLRLSRQPTRLPMRHTILDLLVLLALVQVVVWPLRLVTPWSPARTAALDATLAAWTVLAGALVAATIGSARAGPRNLAMLGCVAMCVGGPILAWMTLAFPALGEPAGALLRFGPLLEVHHLTQGGGAPPTIEQWRWIVLVALAGIAAWCGLGTVSFFRDRKNATDGAGHAKLSGSDS